MERLEKGGTGPVPHGQAEFPRTQLDIQKSMFYVQL